MSTNNVDLLPDLNLAVRNTTALRKFVIVSGDRQGIPTNVLMGFAFKETYLRNLRAETWIAMLIKDDGKVAVAHNCDLKTRFRQCAADRTVSVIPRHW